MDIIGKKATLDDGPDEDDLIDRDLASPQFVSWTARREAKHLLDVCRTLYGEHDLLTRKAKVAHEMIVTIDDEIEVR